MLAITTQGPKNWHRQFLNTYFDDLYMVKKRLAFLCTTILSIPKHMETKFHNELLHVFMIGSHYVPAIPHCYYSNATLKTSRV